MEPDRGGSRSTDGSQRRVEGGGEDGHRGVLRGPVLSLDPVDAFSIRSRQVVAPIALG